MKMHAADNGPNKIMKSGGHETEVIYDFVSVKETLIPCRELVIAHDAYALDQRSEEIMALRTELLMRRKADENAYMMAVLSPCKGEGRSQLAAELAIAFAKMNRPTLLVDADFRNPKQHILFSAGNSCGLAQAIESDQIPDLLGVENLPHLSVMTAGEIPETPLELLTSNKFATMIEYMRNNFEYIIFDTPPVTKYSDGLVIANLVRDVLAISRAKRTPYKRMRDMLRKLSVTNSQLLGGVINRF